MKGIAAVAGLCAILALVMFLMTRRPTQHLSCAHPKTETAMEQIGDQRVQVWSYSCTEFIRVR